MSEKIQAKEHKDRQGGKIVAPATYTDQQEDQTEKPQNQSHAADERISGEQLFNEEKRQRNEPYNLWKEYEGTASSAFRGFDLDVVLVRHASFKTEGFTFATKVFGGGFDLEPI